MSSVPVGSRFYEAPTDFEKPRLIGEYKLLENWDVVLGRNGIRYLNEELVRQKYCCLDLTVGRAKVLEKDYNHDKNPDNILKWIDQHAPMERNLRKACHGADFVCRRGILSQIGQFPHDSGQGFEVVAVRYGGVIFLCEFETDRKLQRDRMSAREHETSSWGYNFENCLTLPTIDSVGLEHMGKSELVKIVEDRAMFLATFGRPSGIRVLLSVELDCIDSGGNFVELKTQAFSLHKGFWRYKSLKWWLQSRLTGISDIVVGFRDNDGRVTSVDTVKVASLADDYRKTWSQHVPINFIETFLQTVKETLEKEPELTYYLCEFKQNASSMTVRPLPDSHQYQFIPASFVARFDSGVHDSNYQ